MTHFDDLMQTVNAEEGHAYAYGGVSLVGIILLVLLLIWLF